MIDISVCDLNKYYGSNHVLKGITFEVYSGEKVGLLGRNGSGKTTLFKVISEEESYESGSISRASGKKNEMLSQIPTFGENDTTQDILYSSFKEILSVHEAMKKIEGDDNPDILARYGKLMEEYEQLGGYDIEVKIEKICNGMNISEGMRKSRFSLLSGGEKTRVNLARILLRDCDILMLDEPTNHLDLSSLGWLEKLLRDYKGTVLVISHDRTFLDNVVQRIIEINDGKLNFYKGNYSYYVDEKERRFLTQAEQYKQQQKKIHQLEAASKRLHEWARQADNEALHKRAFAIEKRIEQMDKVEKPIISIKLTEDFNDGGYAAKIIVSLDLVCKQFGTKTVMDNINLNISRNDHIALVGENGCGKSTLLKLIMNEDTCDSGTVKVSDNVNIAYMPQIIEFDDNNATVLETIRRAFDLSEEKARSILAGFRFRAADVIKRVGNLSGGEKSRLKLCLLMQSKVNFLILDESTNHLDIESREWIEDAVADFSGTILFVSHDRYFLNKFATKIWEMKDSVITCFNCSFDEYLTKTAANANRRNAISSDKKKLPPVKNDKSQRPPSVETLINEAEIELKKVEAAIKSHSVSCDYTELDMIYKEKQQLEAKIDLLYNEWIKVN